MAGHDWEDINFDAKTRRQQLPVSRAFWAKSLELDTWCKDMGLPVDSEGCPVHQVKGKDAVSLLRSLPGCPQQTLHCAI